MAVTIKDVAKLAGVAHGTVSRYINGFELNQENKTKVESAIAALGYKINYAARALKSNSSMTVGIIVRSLVDFFETSIVTVIQDELEAQGYTTMICSCNNDAQVLKTKLEFLNNRGVDGLIIFPPSKSGDVLREQGETAVPMVLVDESIADVQADCVTVDNQAAAFSATNMLITQGHTKIGILANFESSMVAQDRLNGYLDAIRQADIPLIHRYLADGHFTLKEGFQMTRQLMDSDDAPTALLITNYYMAMGAISALESMKLRVPEDVSIISFDYFEPYDNATVSLTCIVQPTQDIGLQSAQRLVAHMQGKGDWKPEQLVLPTRLMVRKSVASPR